MGYFTKPEGSSTDLAPLTTGRVTACMDSHNWHYEVTDEGDVCGWWDTYWFVFSCKGKNHEIFFAHGVWNRGVPVAELTQAALYANEWNTKNFSPMLSVHEREGSIVAFADFSVDYSYGLTDEQLDLHIRNSIENIVLALSWMDSKYPTYIDND